MKHQARRVVTGHDSKGRSIVVSDSVVEAFEASPTALAMRLWATDEFPSNNADERDGAQLIEAFAPENGTAFYLVDWAPDSEFPAHRTSSIDYGVVLSGELEAVLDGGHIVRLGPGDSIVQCGTMHAWRNPTGEWTRTAFVMATSRQLSVDGRALEPTM
ncbi:cupin domain-containing protein [Nocardia stercoris]|uniref:Cupin domain-containing protein n=1 Tax=Nocardia stercoris TaxID=2483361 RepID=A0A3M2L2T3_9NOCA|nr:cupin domain-containing protein [Nocardia stercoris]RMI28828.1 cupin domain-containing protein [Nocardia stercoris]